MIAREKDEEGVIKVSPALLLTGLMHNTLTASFDVQDYKEHRDNLNVHPIVSMSAGGLEKADAQGLLEFFKLTSKLNTSNMICFDFEGKIKKHDMAEDTFEDFYPARLAYYQKRKVTLRCKYSITNLAKYMRIYIGPSRE